MRPEILCIGDMEELKYEHWGKNRDGDGYVNLNGSSIAHKMSAYPGICSIPSIWIIKK